ncbi:MAG: oligosaccharide flippase family protein [Candidatus Bathyarchaeia archaeon]
MKVKLMDKTLEIGKASAVGSLYLFLGVTSSTVIMALGAIILAQLMTPEEYGLYSVALIPPCMMVLFRDWGINSAVTKFTATLRAQNRQEEAYKVIRTGLIFEAFSGLMLTVIAIALSNFIAAEVFGRPESSKLIAIASTTIFIGALLTASQSSFMGFEKMEMNSLTNICQATAKTIISSILVLIGLSSLGAIIGYVASFLTAAAVSLALLYLTLTKNLKIKNLGKTEILKTLNEMLHYGVPFSISSMIGGFLAQFYAFLMAIYCTDVMIGNYHVATQFSTILTFFTIPISTVLFPAFSKISPQDENSLLQTVFQSAAKYTSMLLVPATMAVMVLSKQMINTLFGEKWVYAPLYLTLYVTNNLIVIFGGLIIGNMLAGVGETKMLMKLSLITLACGVPMSYVMIPLMGIIGLIITQTGAGMPSLFLGLHTVWKRYKIRVNIRENMKVLIASAVAAALTFLVVDSIVSVYWIELIIGGAVFLVTYIFTAIFMRAVKNEDIENLRAVFSGLGLFSKLINVFLNVIERTVDIL